MIHTQGKGEKILKKFTVVYIQKGLTLVIYIVENEFRLANDMYSLIGHPLLNFVIFCVQMLMACTHSGERPILCPRWLISFNIIFPFHQKKKIGWHCLYKYSFGDGRTTLGIVVLCEYFLLYYLCEYAIAFGSLNHNSLKYLD